MLKGLARFAYMCAAAGKAVSVARAAQERQTRETREANRHAELHETKLAKENNAILLQDIKIEREKLRIEQEEIRIRRAQLDNERLELDNLKKKKALGLTAEQFTPDNYTDAQGWS